MVLCGFSLFGFSLGVVCDIVTRTLEAPWLWLQEVNSAFFIWGAFIGMAAATRRLDHLMLSALTDALRGSMRTVLELFNRAVVLLCGLLLVWYGSENFMHGFGSFRMPSLTPLAWWYLSIPFAGFFISLFAIEQMVNGWQNGFEPREPQADEADLLP